MSVNDEIELAEQIAEAHENGLGAYTDLIAFAAAGWTHDDIVTWTPDRSCARATPEVV